MPQQFDDDDDEKTTIESSWEEEASTTVEQGEVAEKIRALGMPRGSNNITNVTSTSNSSILDEPTVDDQRANAALSIITPQAVLARLVITQGNDTGQEIEVIPGKNYTIGRAVDNDVVLTDIAVSRKHFDLRHEKGVWVVADRGSGNGTLVNGNLEDQPFTLANGDQIEIGNTTFRFDHPNGAPRSIPQTFDVDLDDGEEPSTVAGKPNLRDEGMTPAQIPPPHMRPKTVPPPPRPRTQSSAPPPEYPPPARMASPSPNNGYAPHAGVPLHSPHQGMQPLISPSPSAASTLPVPGMAGMPQRIGPQAPTMLGGEPPHLQNVMPTTIPGQGPPMAPSQPIMPFYAVSTNPSDLHAQQMMMVATNMPGRDATSTALVQPTPYNGIPAMQHQQQQAFTAPQLSRRTKLILGGAGLALLAAITTVAIIKSSGSDAPAAAPAPTSKGSAGKPQLAPISEVKKPEPKTEPKTEPTKTDPKATKTDPKATKTDPKATKTEPKLEPKVEPKTEPKVEPKVEPKIEPKITKVEPKKEPKVELKKEPKKEPKVERTVEKREKREKRVASADTSEVKNKAAALYRSKRFNDAASTLRSAASSFSDGDAKDLRSLAAVYDQLGKAYNVGMASSTSPDTAYKQLQVALNMENSAGGEFRDEIRAKLTSIASRAAIAFLSNKDYTSAAQAVKLAEQSGQTSSTKLVRAQLEARAKELYDQAAREMDADPSDAKAKLKQIKGLVPSSSPWYQKADKLLSSS